ncbi:ATP-binding cassette subfamily C protein CydC [Evansella vedderi]|uniref:ATP-binding cassette subfamily C protein CydC n=1 Tax=Evansella vedderi TaxID=38282 RepID=A0ABT9ZZC5_9BACI|nr:thiol reductant ABC exporter subunit CydC [Evansella vedderi]MDQ0256061.1 ATP-binding cassette subfamily C protein CydC [Evansella vedderi]
MNELRVVIKLMMKEKKDVLLSILFGFLAGMGAVALFANSGYLISKAAITPPLYILTMSIALLKLFSVTRALSRYAERLYSHRATFTKLSNLRVYFFERLEPLAPRIFHKYRSGDLLSRIVGDVESLQNFFLRVYYPPIVMIIVFLATIAFTAFFSIHVAVFLILGLILTGFVVPLWFTVKQRGILQQLRELRGNVSTEATEFLYGFRDLKLYQRLDEQEKKLTNTADGYVSEQERESVQELSNQSVIQTLSLLVSWAVLGMGAYLVAGGSLDGVFLAMLVMTSITVFENATPMSAFPRYYEDSRRASSRLFSVIEEEGMETRGVEDDWEQIDLTKAPAIDVENLSFTFPGEKRLALKNIHLSLPAGSKTAIVGPSGSGKSTLIQLLLKMNKEYEGAIYLNGTSVRKIKDEAIWKGSNVIMQENHFFYGSIGENLGLAKDDLSEGEMNAVLEKVKLEEFSLTDSVLEKGGNLSGGEKQRLAIARAMLKGSKLWLMDEPTSSVDVLTERMIFDHLLHQGDDDTMILVSHRLIGLEKMDQIIVMDQGEIIESGTYEELMDKQGYFYEMKQIENSVLM